MSDALPNGERDNRHDQKRRRHHLGVSENRSWIELFFEGDLMHTKTVNLPPGFIFDIYVEEIPHKATVYEHPRTMIFFNGPCDVRIARDGNKIIVSGREQNQKSSLA